MDPVNRQPSEFVTLARMVAEETAAEVAQQSEVCPVAVEWLTSEAAARYLGIHVAHLEKLRAQRRGPPYYKWGRAVRYRKADLDAFLLALPRVEA